MAEGGTVTVEPGSAKGQKYLIVEARFYAGIADELLRGATEALKAAGATWDVVTVPGALEIPGAIAFTLEGDEEYDGFVALGCVIRGETTHYELVSGESARGLMDLTILERLALGNGILTVENEPQAWARARVDEQNKGGGAAIAAMVMVRLRRQLSGDE
jgi:6,7-dimethyl-8-ribityllumazine synthase